MFDQQVDILLPDPKLVTQKTRWLSFGNTPAAKRIKQLAASLGQYITKMRAAKVANTEALETLAAPPIRPHQRKANISIAAGVGFLCLWSAVAPIHGAVIARGTINADEHRKSVSHLEGGIIKTIAVHEGQQVEKGQTLLTIDTTQARAQSETIKGKLAPALLIRDRLMAEQSNQSQITWSDIDEYDLPERLLRRLQSQQESLFSSRQRKHINTLSIYRQSLKQMMQQRASLDTQLDMHNQQIALFEEEIAGLETLFMKGLISKVRLRELQRETLEKQSARSTVLSQQSRLRERASETMLKMKITRRAWQSVVVTELQQVEEEIALLTQQRITAEHALSRTNVVAPNGGIVIDLRVHTIGGTIQRGAVLLDIVPTASPLVIHAKVKPEDIDEISPGQTTQVRFSSFSQRTTVPTDALVRSVSADLLSDATTGEKYYLAQIDLGTEREAALHLVAGMPVEVMILTQKRSLYDYLTQPLADSFNRALRET